mgnify:FL=1
MSPAVFHADLETRQKEKEKGKGLGWVEEVPGVNCQEATREELLESLQKLLREEVRAVHPLSLIPTMLP